MNLLVILAAGEGTRLRPLTYEIPKCMIEVNGATMVDQLIKHFDNWADKIIIVTGYKADRLLKYVDSLNHNGKISTIENDRYFETNSMYSAYLTKRYWKQAKEIILSNSDVVFTNNALAPLFTKETEITLAVDIKDCDLEDMRVCIDNDKNKIIRVSKEIPLDLSHGEFTGVAKLKGNGITCFESTIKDLLSDKIMEKKGWYDLVFDHISQNIRSLDYCALPKENYFEIDTLEDLEMVKSKLRNGQ